MKNFNLCACMFAVHEPPSACRINFQRKYRFNQVDKLSLADFPITFFVYKV